MTIEFKCRDCQTTLRVADEHLGKKARCPSCGSIQDVTADTGRIPLDSAGSGQSTSSRWKMRTPDGSEYGPVEKGELDNWMREGRISAQCSLRQENQSQWQPASLIYPSLASASYAPSPQISSSGNPFAAPMQHAQRTPYRPSAHYRPHNGVGILVLGILSLVCCGLLGPVAWIMGNSELAAYRRGEIDPSAHGMIMAGYILGIISSCLIILTIGFYCLMFTAGAMN